MGETERLTRLVHDEERGTGSSGDHGDGPRARGDGGGASVKRSRWLLPPTIALIAIATMIVLHIFMPIAIVMPAPGSYAGVLVLATGVAMIVWSRHAFQVAGTPIRPFDESTVLVRHGLYRWSRNPMYLG